MDADGQPSAGRRARRSRASRAPTSCDGYENNPEANATSFVDGWFRTGDQGFLDADGYLTLAGRLKELINRGGEKISPREIDEVLLAHPAVAEAVCFGVPHPMWGEEVAAAVVLPKEPVQRGRPAGVLQGAAGRLQAAEADSHHRDDSAHRDRQDPAPRRRGGVRRRADAREDRHRRRRRDRRLHRRAARAGRGGRHAVRARPAPAGDAGARPARRSVADGDFEVRPPVTGDLATIGTGRCRVPRRQGARPDRARAAARAAVRRRHRRGQHAERHSVVVLPGSRRRARRAAARARRSGRRDRRRRSSRAAWSDRWPTSRPTSPSPASSITPKATASASANRTAPAPSAARRSPTR